MKGVESYLTKKTLELGALSRFENGQEACYPSEADYNEVEWQKIWYGDSYKYVACLSLSARSGSDVTITRRVYLCAITILTMRFRRELLATKELYDPQGVFTARKAVGSEVVGW